MFCRYCGKKNSNDNNFCSGCGRPLKDDVSEKTGVKSSTGDAADAKDTADESENKAHAEGGIDTEALMSAASEKLSAASKIIASGAKKAGKEAKKFSSAASVKISEGAKAASKKISVGTKAANEKLAEGGEENTAANKNMLIMVGTGLAAILLIVFIVLLGVKGGGHSGAKKSEKGNVINPNAYFYEPFKEGDIITFGSYEQDGDSSNGKEPIKWMVAGNTGGNYLLISQLVLDCQPWDDGSFSGKTDGALEHKQNISYEHCSLRRWLNEEFAAEAFNDKELELILPVSFKGDKITVKNGNKYGEDLAFILSTDEVNKYIKRKSTFSTGLTDKRAAVSAYAISRGEDYSEITTTDAASMGGLYVGAYYLRDTQTEKKKIMPFTINLNGEFEYVDYAEWIGVRPAIYITVGPEDFKTDGKKETSNDTLKYLKYYMGEWNTLYLLFDDGDGVAYERMVHSGNSLFIDEQYVDLSYYTGDISDRYEVSDFEYTQTYNGHDAFVDEKDGIRLVFHDNLLDEGEVLSLQLDGSGVEGWGVEECFKRVGEADKSLRKSKEGSINSINNDKIKEQTVTIKVGSFHDGVTGKGFYGKYSTLGEIENLKSDYFFPKEASYHVDIGEISVDNEYEGMRYNVRTEKDDEGNITLVQFYNDVSVQDYVLDYDSAGRVTSCTLYRYPVRKGRSDVYESHTVYSYSGDQLTMAKETNSVGCTTEYFTYDDAGRLVYSEYQANYVFTVPNNDTYVSQEFEYDDSGKVYMITVRISDSFSSSASIFKAMK